MSERSFPLKFRTIERFDGSRWRQFESKDNIFYLTSMGRHLLASEKTAKLLNLYAQDYLNNPNQDGNTRRFLAEGTDARVYTAGERLVIKESKSDGNSLWRSIERMDRLIDSVQQHCPRWIDIPEHYGIMVPKSDTSKAFMLIEKIDHGVTAGDIMTLDDPCQSRIANGKLNPESIKNFGPIDDYLKDEVQNRYSDLLVLLRQALISEYLSPDEYLPDIDHNPYNIVLEKLVTPIAKSSLRYWIIDQ